MLLEILDELIILNGLKDPLTVIDDAFITHAVMFITHKKARNTVLCSPESHSAVSGQKDVGMKLSERVCKFILLLGTYSVVPHISVVLDALVQLIILKSSGIEKRIMMEY